MTRKTGVHFNKDEFEAVASRLPYAAEYEPIKVDHLRDFPDTVHCTEYFRKHLGWTWDEIEESMLKYNPLMGGNSHVVPTKARHGFPLREAEDIMERVAARAQDRNKNKRKFHTMA